MTVPEFLQPFLGTSPRTAQVLYGILAGMALLVLFLIWLRWGKLPRRRRAARAAAKALNDKDWPTANAKTALVKKLAGRSRYWKREAQRLEGKCLQQAGERALGEAAYEESLEHFRLAAEYLELDAAEGRRRVLEAMHAHLYRLFIEKKQNDLENLAGRITKLTPESGMPLFWQALGRWRQGKGDDALALLQKTAALERTIDPYLYLGTLQLRRGQVQEALRVLSEAHRLDKENPLVNLQLGQAIVAAGGDRLAVRPLQRTLDESGLASWLKQPERFWSELMAGTHVGRLAELHPFRCPVFGDDINVFIRQGREALAHAHYRLGKFTEAADLFLAVLQESPPTLPLLRGLGTSLAKLGRFDEAFKHLKIAFEMEEPRRPLTAAYLAACGARGKPNRPEDKEANVSWAVKLLARYSDEENAEWTGLASQVFAEARALHLPVPIEEQQRLCQALVKAEVCDDLAADAFEQLASESPEMVRDEYAWLYCRAHCQSTNSNGRPERLPIALALFTRTCRLDSGARQFFSARAWNFADVEFAYLGRLAAGTDRPAAFQLRPDQEQLLLTRAETHEQARRWAEAARCVEVLHRLAPQHGLALDRLAFYLHRQGLLDRAADCLVRWHHLEPQSYIPLQRLAVVEQQRGCSAEAYQAVNAALERCHDNATRSAMAFLGGRLALATYYMDTARKPGNPHWLQARQFLESALAAEPTHAGALGTLSALLAQAGERTALAALGTHFDALPQKTPVLHYLEAVTRLAAGNPPSARRAAEHSLFSVRDSGPKMLHGLAFPANFPIAEECAYLIGQAARGQGDLESAARTLATCAAAQGPSADLARAWLGTVHFERGNFEEATRWWRAVAPRARRAWKLDLALRDTVVQTALAAYEAGQFEQALDCFREAGRLGWNDPRRDQFMNHARLCQAQRLLAEEPDQEYDVVLDEPDETGTSSVLNPRVINARSAAFLLEQAVQHGAKQDGIALLLARARQQLNELPAARAALLSLPHPDVGVCLQLGLLSLRELAAGAPGKLAQAEADFERALAQPVASESARRCQQAACLNLFQTRLTQGKLAAAAEILPRVLDQTRDGDALRQGSSLQTLLRAGLETQPDPQLLAALAGCAENDELALLDRLRHIGNLDVVVLLLRTLLKARPSSLAARQAAFECDLLRAKSMLDRCQPLQAAKILSSASNLSDMPAEREAALFNLLGCCSCLTQDFDAGTQYFLLALEQTPQDPRLLQNLALSYEIGKRFARADKAWDHFLDSLSNRIPAPRGHPDYHQQVAFTCLTRLAQRYYDQETWATALDYLRRAYELRPDNADVLERLFHVYNQLKHFADARAILERLRRQRADLPHFELYELELMEVKGPDDLDSYLNALAGILQRHAGEAAVSDRGRALLGHVLEYIANLGRQYREQLDKTTRSLERLPSYQINWPEVHRFLRELRGNFKKIGRLLDRCQALPIVTDVHQRRLQQLRGGIEECLRQCRTLGG